jgi:succinoglycan biosynthesis protein ExoA
MKNNNISDRRPLVSIIMPVFNEAIFIRRSLGALLAQTYPKERLEIIIADGMSTDNTRKVISQVSDKSEISIKIIDNLGKIAPAGLNRAIENSKGEIIIRVDGHCEVEPDYVANCVKHLLAGTAESVGGPIETIGETLQAQAIAIAMSSKFGVGGSAFRTINDREMYVDTVAFPGYKKETFDRVGVFNEELVRNQDDEFNYRLRKLGGRIILTPDIRSRYFSRSSFQSLWRQYYQYGYWKVRVLQLHPRQMSLRQFIPFVFVSTILMFGILSIFSHVVLLGLLVILGSYLGGNLLATIQASLRTKIIAIPYVFLSFAILHFSYGLGFLIGLFVFRNKWRTIRTKEIYGTET